MKIYNLRVQLVKHAGNDMRLQFLKLLPPSIRLDCSGYSLVFPRTKPYLNTNKIRQILCCIGTQGSSMATWICHAWLTSILSKCTNLLPPYNKYTLSLYISNWYEYYSDVITPLHTIGLFWVQFGFLRTKPYLNTNIGRQILCCPGTIGSSMATWIRHAWLTSILSKCTKIC